MTTEQRSKPPPKLTAEDLDSMSENVLATFAVEWKREGRAFLDGADLAQFELEKRMEQSGATQLDTESWTGKLASKGYTHSIGDDGDFCKALLAAGVSQQLLDKEAYAKPPPVPRTRRWDMRTLNELHKLGGKIAEAIDQYRRSTPNRKRLELKAKIETPEEETNK